MTDKSNVYNEVTNNISITVQPQYVSAESNPAIGKNIFSYNIVITNLGLDPVKLLSRHWYIVDSNTSIREIEGDGVVGKQPELAQNESFEYTSWCLLQTSVGKMYGTYIFPNMDNNQPFEVVIPEFRLHSDFILN